MPDNKKLHLILCWHMHQPDYRSYATGEYVLPWTYLHAIKDYTDMASHLEQNSDARAVLNFAPVLLDQIEDYAAQFASGRLRDPLLRQLGADDLDNAPPEIRKLILDSGFSNNQEKMVKPYPNYLRLLDLFKTLEAQRPDGLAYLSGQYLADLLTWYHLAWTGETVRREHELVQRLMAKGSHFTLQDRRALLDLIGTLIGGIIPRYRELAAAGRIELSTTPHYHPIVPLLIDFRSARQSSPQADLPEAPAYPDGAARATFHVRSAIERHRSAFGMTPAGMWPAEGGISVAAASMFAEHGCRWTATGEGVLLNSLRALRSTAAMPERIEYLYRPYRVGSGNSEIICFFRDDRLSDRIGFEYAKWFGKDAAGNFVLALEEIWRTVAADESPVVSVILDGENPWEAYPYNGYYFLHELYSALARHPFIRMSTFREYLAAAQLESGAGGPGKGVDAAHAHFANPGSLASLVAGSWVYGTFSTWIGSPDKNRAWDLLCAAKASFDEVMASGNLSPEERRAAERQLAVCESSDWFWWFGDYNPAQSVASFDRLYREHLGNLYRVLKLPMPQTLAEPVSAGHGHPEAGGAMRRAS